jgi:hypothetical protein
LVDDHRFLKSFACPIYHGFAICGDPSQNAALCPFTLREMVIPLRQMDQRDNLAQRRDAIPKAG